MRIEKIHIKGFRNFDDAEISLQSKTLIIGANDVEKTSLTYYAILLLKFVKSLQKPKESLRFRVIRQIPRFAISSARDFPTYPLSAEVLF